MKREGNWFKENHWFWYSILGYVFLIVVLRTTHFGLALADSGEWFWMSLVSMVLGSLYSLSFQFFGGPRYKLEPSIQHACFCLGCGIGMFFNGTMLGMVQLESYSNFLPMGIVAVMGLFLTGAPSNLMVSMAVRAKGINPSLPFVISNSSNFWMYLLASVLAVALPQYFKEASWNFWSAISLAAIILGLVIIRMYGLPVKASSQATDSSFTSKTKPASEGRLKWWLLEGNWFSKAFSAMLVITVYLTSFQFFGHFFRLDPVVQHSVYLFFMGCGIFLYSKIIGLFPAQEYKKYAPMAIVCLMGVAIGGWWNGLVTMSLRTPGLNPGLPFIVSNSYPVVVYVVGHWLALKFSQFNKTVFNWQTGLGIIVVLAALLVIKLFG